MTENELQNLLKQYHVPKHIMSHMQKVADVALFIGKKLSEKNIRIDMELLRQAALLHDLVKICDLSELDLTDCEGFTAEDIQFWAHMIRSCRYDGHVNAAYNILIDLKENKLAEIVKKHRFNSVIDANHKERPVTWEEKILYYADKRVRHESIVSIKERIEDGRRRYFPEGKIPPDERLVEKQILKLETELCRLAGIAPEDINKTNLQET